jgi:hypothetical protein
MVTCVSYGNAAEQIARADCLVGRARNGRIPKDRPTRWLQAKRKLPSLTCGWYTDVDLSGGVGGPQGPPNSATVAGVKKVSFHIMDRISHTRWELIKLTEQDVLQWYVRFGLKGASIPVMVAEQELTSIPSPPEKKQSYKLTEWYKVITQQSKWNKGEFLILQ